MFNISRPTYIKDVRRDRQRWSFDLQTADVVAAGMKKWAMELGVTHCTHWFQPLTEGTAEKT